MDCEGFAEQNHNIIAATFLTKKKQTAVLSCKWNFKFLARLLPEPKFFIVASKLAENNFTCK